jgi:hypothetical protein
MIAEGITLCILSRMTSLAWRDLTFDRDRNDKKCHGRCVDIITVKPNTGSCLRQAVSLYGNYHPATACIRIQPGTAV